jgi:hypothetical protein
MERQTVWGDRRIMGESDMRQRNGRAQHAGGSAFDLVASKLHRPLVRPGTVRRSSLVERLARSGPCPVVSVVAPAGYGKTTLLSQWAERDGQAFAWVSVDEADNDPKVLLSYVAEALDAGRPPGGPAHGVRLPAGPGRHHPAVVWLAGGPGRDRETPDRRRARFVLFRADGQAG